MKNELCKMERGADSLALADARGRRPARVVARLGWSMGQVARFQDVQGA